MENWYIAKQYNLNYISLYIDSICKKFIIPRQVKETFQSLEFKKSESHVSDTPERYKWIFFYFIFLIDF